MISFPTIITKIFQAIHYQFHLEMSLVIRYCCLLIGRHLLLSDIQIKCMDRIRPRKSFKILLFCLLNQVQQLSKFFRSFSKVTLKQSLTFQLKKRKLKLTNQVVLDTVRQCWIKQLTTYQVTFFRDTNRYQRIRFYLSMQLILLPN